MPEVLVNERYQHLFGLTIIRRSDVGALNGNDVDVSGKSLGA
jgi:hypothetical protein